ncbi:MAG: hypothetical protein AB7I19_11160 [Planctomycetota bacterium]
MVPLTRFVLAAIACLAADADDPTEIDFASLSDFTWVQGMKLPEHVTKWNEKKVRISGFMERDGAGVGPVDYFMLINDSCGCEGTPMMNEIIFCDMPPGQQTDILPGVVTIEGKLFVGEVEEDGVVLSIYNFDVDRVTQ